LPHPGGKISVKWGGGMHAIALNFTSGNPRLQGTDGGSAWVGWALLAHRHIQGFFFFLPLSNK